jgi:hypothetical protein
LPGNEGPLFWSAVNFGVLNGMGKAGLNKNSKHTFEKIKPLVIAQMEK